MQPLDNLIPELIGRELHPNILDVTKYLADKTVMVTGAGGSIGSALCKKIMAFKPKTLILYEMSEFALYTVHQELPRLRPWEQPVRLMPVLGRLDSINSLAEMLSIFKVDTLYHAAAYKHVPMVERNPCIGVINNVFGTNVLIEAAKQAHVRNVVTVSTDKAVNPTSIMGATKRLAEYITLHGCMRYKVVRFGNVLWSAGSVLPLFSEQLQCDQKVTITHPEATRYFMSIPEAVDLILQSTALDESICVFDMGKPVKIQDMAARLARILGKKADIQYIGLRPGEKLGEELTLGESLVETKHPHINAAIENLISQEELKTALDELRVYCKTHDVTGIRTVLAKVIPGYNPVCGIVDDLWLEEYVLHAMDELDDCYSPTPRRV